MYDLAISKLNAVLKCFDGPAHIVRPGVNPPSRRPDNATLIIGTSVVIISFSVKNFDLERIELSLIVEFFFNLSSMLMQTPQMFISYYTVISCVCQVFYSYLPLWVTLMMRHIKYKSNS